MCGVHSLQWSLRPRPSQLPVSHLLLLPGRSRVEVVLPCAILHFLICVRGVRITGKRLSFVFPLIFFVDPSDILLLIDLELYKARV